jgi:SAM-dependent methyltransferase
MAELGPGDSLGIGVAALLSGLERYIGLDVVRYADNVRNLQIFEELVTLFRARRPIPDDVEFPLLRPPLRSYAFPEEILTPARLNVALAPQRLDTIRAALSNPATSLSGRGPVWYIAPWQPDWIGSGAIDLILSQTVLEFPPDLAGLYQQMYRWLKPGGIMSHEIDFKSIGITRDWNGHWSCSDALWRLAVGRRRHRINRAPHSTHVALLRKMGCRVVSDERVVQPSGITRAQLAPRFRHLTEEDLTTSSALIQAIKPACQQVVRSHQA